MKKPAMTEQPPSAESLWTDLVEKDDRTSPPEYPDMALITFEEFEYLLNHYAEWVCEQRVSAALAEHDKAALEVVRAAKAHEDAAVSAETERCALVAENEAKDYAALYVLEGFPEDLKRRDAAERVARRIRIRAPAERPAPPGRHLTPGDQSAMKRALVRSTKPVSPPAAVVDYTERAQKWKDSLPNGLIPQFVWDACKQHFAAALSTVASEREAIADAQMELVKACEHIAEGTEGWEVLRNLCPSCAAVASLRDAYESRMAASEHQAEIASMRSLLDTVYECERTLIAQRDAARADWAAENLSAIIAKGKYKALLARLREPDVLAAVATLLAQEDTNAYEPEYKKRAASIIARIEEMLK